MGTNDRLASDAEVAAVATAIAEVLTCLPADRREQLRATGATPRPLIRIVAADAAAMAALVEHHPVAAGIVLRCLRNATLLAALDRNPPRTPLHQAYADEVARRQQLAQVRTPAGALTPLDICDTGAPSRRAARRIRVGPVVRRRTQRVLAAWQSTERRGLPEARPIPGPIAVAPVTAMAFGRPAIRHGDWGIDTAEDRASGRGVVVGMFGPRPPRCDLPRTSCPPATCGHPGATRRIITPYRLSRILAKVSARIKHLRAECRRANKTVRRAIDQARGRIRQLQALRARLLRTRREYFPRCDWCATHPEATTITQAAAQLYADTVCQEHDAPPVVVEFTRRRGSAFGHYHPPTGTEPARIEVHGVRGQTMETLLHELGHHLAWTHGYRGHHRGSFPYWFCVVLRRWMSTQSRHPGQSAAPGDGGDVGDMETWSGLTAICQSRNLV
jgi:hypothetical protein